MEDEESFMGKSYIHQRNMYSKRHEVITVRNPFDRIVSAYVSKLTPAGAGFNQVYAPMSRRIKEQYKHLRHDIQDRNEADDDVATFEDFVNFLVDIKGPREIHWQFYHELCRPCQSHYDYIIKFETMRDDIEFLSNYLNISEEHRKIFFPQMQYRSQPNKVDQYFEKIPRNLVLNLYNAYKKDFVLFDYDRPYYLN
ncbi:unnamed protein product [Clavelina lepadiformis]|uniref:Carbohydrate sulfotransferase n=1 Tax=Clavelina lepadiformis TaxID=159417 RepID=A0ABP0G5G7_CLALP